jgi:hypothetical protein
MTEVVIQPGGHRDGWIWVCVNGVEQWVRAGEETDLDAAEIEVLDHAMISYSATASGDFTSIATNNVVDGVFTLNGVICTLEDIVDLSDPDATFDPDLDIDEGGIAPRDVGGGSFSGRSLSIKDPLLSQILANGCTTVFETFVDDTNTNKVGMAGGDPPDYLLAPEASLSTTPPDATLRFGSADQNTLNTFPYSIGGGIQKVAITLLPDGGMSGSVNGSEVHTSAADFFAPTVVKLYFTLGAAPAGRLRSFVFYDVVDDADLPTLSAL